MSSVRRLASVVLVGSLLGPNLLVAQQPKFKIGGLQLDSPAMLDSLAAPFWRILAAAPCSQVVWAPDLSSPAALRASAKPLFDRLQQQTGPLPRPQGNVLSTRRVYAGPRYEIDEVVYETRLRGVTAFGYLVKPRALGRSSPLVILLAGSGSLPFEAFGWQLAGAYHLNTRFANAAFVGTAREFADAGYTVFVPWLADDEVDDFWPKLQWEQLERNGMALRAKTQGVGPYGFLVPEVSGAIDFLQQLPGVAADKVTLIGWAEGAQLAAIDAAMDGRVTAVVELAAPLDRRALRSTVMGTLGGAQFTHVDCALGDAEMAALVAPRPLLYAYSPADQSVARFAAFISTTVEQKLRSLYSGLGAGKNLEFFQDSVWTAASLRHVRTWVDSAISFTPRPMPGKLTEPLPSASDLYSSEHIDSTRVQRRTFVAKLGPCTPPIAHPSFGSLPRFLSSVEPLREAVRNELRVSPIASERRVSIVRRDTLVVRHGYTLEFITATSDRTSLPIAGLLATPREGGDDLPVVISLDGNYGLGAPFGLFGPEPAPYLNAYADALASAGSIVFAPFMPPDFPEIAAAELQAREPGALSSWSYVVPYYASAVDLVRSLSGVDTSRVGIWGISYEGFAALYMTALDTRINALVYSNPVNSGDILFRNPDAAGLAGWYSEICGSMDAVQTYLITPRRLVRENGLRDANGYERTHLESVERVQAVYQSLGLSRKFDFIRRSGGHETVPQGIRVFIP